VYLLEQKLFVYSLYFKKDRMLDELGSFVQYEVFLLYIYLLRVRCADRVNK
jgi:hypothetical protein